MKSIGRQMGEERYKLLPFLQLKYNLDSCFYPDG